MIQRRVFLAATALPTLAWAQAKPEDDPARSEPWLKVRAALFGSRPITHVDDGRVTLQAPARAEDAAVVPIALSAAMPVKRMWLVTDHNPSPLSATFVFGPATGPAQIETRVRVDSYTVMRAIAETETGELLMTTRFVKASGGCSAPPGKDPAAALATLGRMRLRVEGTPRAGQPLQAQLMISHPNHSGLAMDQLTRQFTPAHFVRDIVIRYGNQDVLTADVDFSISENPNLRFWFTPREPGALAVHIEDNQGLAFNATQAVTF
ncbi:MAG: quinoprotein dehydrogenase-associated SoxYZ-like carrier [Proteobacteria bacterium]|nr:quinoprotein dehydrogenase-associated SoxYZ-like carrier [Pseudomonadota bacterium]